MSEPFSHGHAVVVGVGADLPNTVDDAKGLARILRDPERCAYPGDQVRLLTGDGATRNEFLGCLDDLAARTTEESTVIIYFSGHGYQTRSTFGSIYYLIPFGCDIDRLHETAVRGGEFADKLAAVPAKKMLVLLDCCHAGGIDVTKAPAGAQITKSPMPPEAGPLLKEGSGRVLIASSTAEEVSFAGKPYSAFTLALIEALAGRGASRKDGYVRAADLALYTREMVPQRTENRQHPILEFEKADNFRVAYYAAGESVPKELPFTGEPEIEEEPGQWRGGLSVSLQGSGAIASGDHARAVGRGGVIAEGPVSGPIITGDHVRAGDEYSGDLRGAIVNVVGATLTGAKQAVSGLDAADATAKEELRQLIEQLEGLLGRIPSTHAKEAERVSELTESLVTDAASETPNKTLLQITGDSLKRLAGSLATIAPEVLPVAARIVAAVGRIASVS